MQSSSFDQGLCMTKREKLMFQKIFFSAIISGLLTGLLVSAIHQKLTVPIIHQAEKYETTEIEKATRNTPPYIATAQIIKVHNTDDHGTKNQNPEAPKIWSPKDGLERTLYTALTTVLTSIGFALLLTSAYAISKQTISGSIGVMWGIAGFAALSLAPALGLPPELPGTAAADLQARQIWWLGTALFTSSGIAILVFAPTWILRTLGIALILCPHALGAPHPDHYGTELPAELGGQFVAASLAASFILWTMLGWLSGTIYQKMENQIVP